MLFDDTQDGFDDIELSTLATPFDQVSHQSSSQRLSKRSRFSSSTSSSRDVHLSKPSLNIITPKSTPPTSSSKRKSLLPFRPTHPSKHVHVQAHSHSSPPSRPHSSFASQLKSVSSSSRSKSTPGSRTSSVVFPSSHSRASSIDQKHYSFTRIPLNLDWLTPKVDADNFIDMRDDGPESDSRSDSWQSLFEVSCTA